MRWDLQNTRKTKMESQDGTSTPQTLNRGTVSPEQKRAALNMASKDLPRTRALFDTAISPTKLIAIARTHSSRAIEVLAEVMQDEVQPPAVRIRAAELLLERGYGKTAQAVLVSTNDGNNLVGPHSLSIAEKIAALKEASQKSKDAPIDLEPSAAIEISSEVIEEDPIG